MPSNERSRDQERDGSRGGGKGDLRILGSSVVEKVPVIEVGVFSFRDVTCIPLGSDEFKDVRICCRAVSDQGTSVGR